MPVPVDETRSSCSADTVNGESCVPCRLAAAPLPKEKIRASLATLPGGWTLEDEATRLKRRYSTRNFAQSLELVNRIGAEAESMDHHPDIAFGWGWVEVILWTHKVNGLTDADFVLARRIESIPRESSS